MKLGLRPRPLLCALAIPIVAAACHAGARGLPEPEYQKAPLPPWEPPPSDDTGVDPSSLQGEWAEGGAPAE